MPQFSVDCMAQGMAHQSILTAKEKAFVYNFSANDGKSKSELER